MTHSIELDSEAWERACRLIATLGANIGGITPGSHATLYSDLNEHFLLVAEIARKDQADTVAACEPIAVTDEMIAIAIEKASARSPYAMRDLMHETAREYAASGNVLTPDALIEVAVNRYIGKREAWLAQGGLRGEEWKKANPNWTGGR